MLIYKNNFWECATIPDSHCMSRYITVPDKFTKPMHCKGDARGTLIGYKFMYLLHYGTEVTDCCSNQLTSGNSHILLTSSPVLPQWGRKIGEKIPHCTHLGQSRKALSVYVHHINTWNFILSQVCSKKSQLHEPCVEFCTNWFCMTTNIMAPESKCNICCCKCEQHLKVQRWPALQQWKRFYFSYENVKTALYLNAYSDMQCLDIRTQQNLSSQMTRSCEHISSNQGYIHLTVRNVSYLKNTYHDLLAQRLLRTLLGTGDCRDLPSGGGSVDESESRVKIQSENETKVDTLQ